MAPKRRSARVVKTVITTKKVVEEVVKVVVTPGGKDGNKKAELLSSSTKELSQNIEISTPSPDEPEPASGTVQVQEKPTSPPQDETQPDSEPETSPTPPQNPEEKKKAAGKRKAGGGEKGAGAGKKRRKRGGGGCKRYVLMVMKQVHPGMGISSKAMTIIDNLMGDMFGRLAEEAGQLLKYTRRQTMTSREVQGAVKLGKHAIAEGTKAVTNYVSYVSEQK